jgi:hypothetical protein
MLSVLILSAPRAWCWYTNAARSLLCPMRAIRSLIPAPPAAAKVFPVWRRSWLCRRRHNYDCADSCVMPTLADKALVRGLPASVRVGITRHRGRVVSSSFWSGDEGGGIAKPVSKGKRCADAGPLASFVDEFRNELLARGYSVWTAVNQLRQAGRLSAWLAERGLSAADVNEERISRFPDFQRAGGRHRSQWSRPGLICVLDVLRRAGATPAARPPGQETGPSAPPNLGSNRHSPPARR